MCSERTSADTVTTATSTALELDDIQSGMLHQRPASYVGTYLLLHIDDRWGRADAGPAAAPGDRVRAVPI